MSRTPGAGTAMVVALLAAGAAVAVAAGPGLPSLPSLPSAGSPCRLDVGQEDVGLDVDEARRLTTLVAEAERTGTPVPASAAEPGVVAALRGESGPALTCRADRATGLERQDELPSGLTPRAERLREQLVAAYGDLPLGGFAPGGVSTGHIEGSAHYEGRAIDVFFRPAGGEQRRLGWSFAHWLVAHAEPLELSVVIFDDHIWSVRRSDQGWRDYVHPSGDTDNPVLRHLDHVHVDVREGG